MDLFPIFLFVILSSLIFIATLVFIYYISLPLLTDTLDHFYLNRLKTHPSDANWNAGWNN